MALFKTVHLCALNDSCNNSDRWLVVDMGHRVTRTLLSRSVLQGVLKSQDKMHLRGNSLGKRDITGVPLRLADNGLNA